MASSNWYRHRRSMLRRLGEESPSVGSGPRYAGDAWRIELTARIADRGQNTYHSSPTGIVRSSATLARLFSPAGGGLIPILIPRESRPVIAD